MKKLCVKLSYLIIPIAIWLISIELVCRTQTSFGIKKHFLDTNLNSIEVLILGSSHNQNAINPEFLSKKTSNLAFGGQPVSIDYYLLDKYIDKMPHLNTVFLELSPHSFYRDLIPSAYNGHIYSILYNISYNTEAVSYKNYSLVLSDYEYFSSIFNSYCKTYKHNSVPIINKFGFTKIDIDGRFSSLKYDTAKINKTFVMGHRFTDISLLNSNKLFLRNSIIRCQRKGIKVILITPPLYTTYMNQIPSDAKKEVASFTHEIVTEFGIKYFDYSCDKRFNIYDFKNDDHLNSNGAKKFCKIINDEILNN